ncbi:MAG: acyl-CoA dehydrogenase family protein [Bacillota bacterium]|jgi:alkylation response protein AidB-like acyl-CoA dehydrogenase|nr:acyl-CoA dehydrogenase family protein [Bacillota bacterium]HOB89378.1 acyl-CoA dehydrogenase family protein [Bacillota bacterium]HPZ92488.1 acyl-CoA dehydrogenase family protein [Bacillota bacterium]HQE03677.1 acyl-CoA dehydrogenase family protein [Bacillota bacterium]
MNYFLTEEQEIIKELSAKIADEKIAPRAAEFDESEEFPWDLIRVIADADLFAVWVPEEYGGLGGGVFEQCLVVEELSRACAAVAVSYAASGLGGFPILMFGTEEQKQKYMPEIASGSKLAAFALTEPDAGSDAGNIRTTAVRDGDFYVLNGTKQWITNGGEADIYVVFATVDPEKGQRGMTAFIVEKGTPGFDFGKKEKKMGIRASSTTELIFKDCRIPAENLLGREGKGFLIAMRTLDKTRPGVAAQAVGIAQGALDKAAEYASTRVQFGKRIGEFQAVEHMLADMATQVEAARSLVYSVARTIDAGEPNITKASSMAKLFASDVAMKVTCDAVQIFGGYGYMRDYPVEKMMRDAKITQIYEGTNQIQRSIIGSAVLKEAARRK